MAETGLLKRVNLRIPSDKGVRTFVAVWLGQLVSTVGSGLTSFALGVWVYQETGSTTLFALNLLAFALPNLLLSPISGVAADRWDRRLVMIMSDCGAALSTFAAGLLIFTGSLEVWHVYLLTAVNAAFTSFQWPAYSAATTLLVPKEHLGRAGGMVQIGEAISQLISPAVAGALMVTVGLEGVVVLDFATFLFAIGTLVFVRFPQPEETEEGKAGRGSFWKEFFYGWQYITARPGLFGLLMIFAANNFFFGLMYPLLVPMLLEMTTADVVGYLFSLVGVGMLVGTVVMSLWGGPKRRIHGVLGFMMVQGFFMIFLGIRPSLVIMSIAGFLMMFMNPIINGSSQALWQSKVAVDVQGRVFAVRRMFAWIAMPMAYILAGPLADYVFNPLLVEGGALAESVGKVIGVGQGRGSGFLFIWLGCLTLLVSFLGYIYPRVRLVEDELPDAVPDDAHAQRSADEPAAAAD
jgi:MFS family permease